MESYKNFWWLTFFPVFTESALTKKEKFKLLISISYRKHLFWSSPVWEFWPVHLFWITCFMTTSATSQVQPWNPVCASMCCWDNNSSVSSTAAMALTKNHTGWNRETPGTQGKLGAVSCIRGFSVPCPWRKPAVWSQELSLRNLVSRIKTVDEMCGLSYF